MSSVQQLLDDINLRYRNTFTTDQKITWMNDVLQIMYQVLKIEDVPYSFTTIAGTYLYPVPTGVDIDNIADLTIQTTTSTTPTFQSLPYKRGDEQVDPTESFYSIIQNNFFINAPGIQTGYIVYIYPYQTTQLVSSSALSNECPVPSRYQEAVKLGVLERIAGARKDIDMKDNYAVDFEQAIADFEWNMKSNEPEWFAPINSLPVRG